MPSIVLFAYVLSFPYLACEVLALILVSSILQKSKSEMLRGVNLLSHVAHFSWSQDGMTGSDKKLN